MKWCGGREESVSPVAFPEGTPAPFFQRLVYEVAQAADLHEQMDFLLRRAIAHADADSGLTARVDLGTMRLEILSVSAEGSSTRTGEFLEPGSREWKLLLSDGVVRDTVLFPGSTLGVNLFVPTADPAVPRCVVHLEWKEHKTPEIEPLETLLTAFRAVANMVANAEKARAYDHLRHGPASDSHPAPDLELDEPRLDLLLKKTGERIVKLLGRPNVSIFLSSGGVDVLNLLPCAFVGDLDLDPSTLPRAIYRRQRAQGTVAEERRRFRSASGLPFAALDQGRTVVTTDDEPHSQHTRFFRGQGPSVAVPLILGDERLGAIHVEGADGRAFQAEELQALERLSKDLALSIVKANAYEESRRRNPREAILLVGLPRPLLEQAFIAGPVESTLFIEGETGAGKEMFARFVHYLGPRRRRPFVTLDCSAVASTLVESHLFGHVKGAFTGADQDAGGVFFEADDGTVFIDEVDALSWDLQGKLLRVLERRTLKPVGAGSKEFFVRARIIVATNADLQERVERGLFRKDLYYRLDVLRVRIPPLREMRPAIPRIAQVLVDEAAEFNRKKFVALTPAAGRILREFPFAGNVRQLRNAMERAVVVDRDGKIDIDDLPPEIARAIPLRSGSEPTASRSSSASNGTLSKDRLLQTLKECRGNVTEASARLRIGRRHLYKLFKKLGLNPECFRIED
jgi:DNA-binding NtrC family response regulator